MSLSMTHNGLRLAEGRTNFQTLPAAAPLKINISLSAAASRHQAFGKPMLAAVINQHGSTLLDLELRCQSVYSTRIVKKSQFA